MKKVVVIGGGTGVFTVLTGLKEYDYHLSAVVSMADDGGSSGQLREEFGTLPAGDIRRALIALSDSNEKILSDLFNFRFGDTTSLHGHSLGNLLLTALEKITGNFSNAIDEAVKILKIKGSVIPVTFQNTRLFAELENGAVIEGETNIDIPKHDGNVKIKDIFLKPLAKANPKAVGAIMNADVVILGPGDLYTSVLPNIIIPEIAQSLKKTRARVLYVVNIMTKFGETNDFKTSNFVQKIEEYIGENVISYIIINTKKPTGAIVQRYKKEHVGFVENDMKNDKRVIGENFLRRGLFLRHDADKLAKGLSKIIG